MPIINKGPELFVKASILSASFCVHNLLEYKSDTILAPTGYPLISPITKGNEATPGKLKIGFIYLSNFMLKKYIRFVCFKSSTATKNGKSEGTTLLAHKVMPFFAALKLLFVKKTRKNKYKIKIIEIDFSFK